MDFLVAPRPEQDFSVGSQRFGGGAAVEGSSAVLRNDSVELGPVGVSIEHGFRCGPTTCAVRAERLVVYPASDLHNPKAAGALFLTAAILRSLSKWALY